MFDMIRKIWRVGTVTRKQPFVAAPARYRGKIVIKDIIGTDWETCIAACPTQALSQKNNMINLFHGNCIMCGACVDACNTEAIKQTNECYLATTKKEELYIDIKKK